MTPRFTVDLEGLVNMPPVDLRPRIEQLRRIAIRNISALELRWCSVEGENRVEAIMATSAKTIERFSVGFPVGTPLSLLAIVSLAIRAAAENSLFAGLPQPR